METLATTLGFTMKRTADFADGADSRIKGWLSCRSHPRYLCNPRLDWLTSALEAQ